MSAGLIGSSFAFPGLGSGITASSACSGTHGSVSGGGDVIDFGDGVKFPRFLSDISRRNPTGTLVGLVLLAALALWLLFGGDKPRRRSRRRK